MANILNLFRNGAVGFIGWLGRVRFIPPIATENAFREKSERDSANNCYIANPLPPGWSKRQNSKTVPEGCNRTEDKKRPGEEAVNSPAARSVDQTRYTHEPERHGPQNCFQSKRRTSAEHEDKPRYTPKKKRFRPCA